MTTPYNPYTYFVERDARRNATEADQRVDDMLQQLAGGDNELLEKFRTEARAPKHRERITALAARPASIAQTVDAVTTEVASAHGINPERLAEVMAQAGVTPTMLRESGPRSRGRR